MVLADLAALQMFSLRRAWPRSADHLLLDLAGPDGPVAGQWFADADRAAHVAQRTGAPARACGRVVLQPRGADRRLPALRGLLDEPGSALVAHRPERRAVVRRADGAYAKAVRPERAQETARAARDAGAPGLRVPQVLDVDEDRGVVTTAALPGRTLHALLTAGDAAAVPAARAVGAVLARLHAAPVAPGSAVHDGAAEQQVLRRWRSLAQAHGAELDGQDDARLVDEPPGPLVRVHRDLHDKQLLVDDDGGVGLLDFDLAAAGEAALDLANLLVHLELRAAQRLCRPELAAAARDAVLAGYDPSEEVLRRVPAYAAAARQRLVAVYAFRPASRAAARLLVPAALTGAGAVGSGAGP